MARQNALRTVGGEANLAERICDEREQREWSYETLARKLTDAGCSINGSAIFKIEKGNPPRRITVDEMVALSRVFDTTIEDLLTPIELLRKDRANALVATIEASQQNMVDGIGSLVNGYIELFGLTVDDAALAEYAQNIMAAPGVSDGSLQSRLFSVLVGDDETDRTEDVDDARLRAAVVEVYASLFELAGRVTSMSIEQ